MTSTLCSVLFHPFTIFLPVTGSLPHPKLILFFLFMSYFHYPSSSPTYFLFRIHSSLILLRNNINYSCGHQMDICAPLSSHPLQFFLSFVFLLTVILMERKGNLNVTLIYIFLLAKYIEHIFRYLSEVCFFL